MAAAIRRLGAREVAQRLDINLESTLRLASGEPVRRATERLARANLSALRRVPAPVKGHGRG